MNASQKIQLQNMISENGVIDQTPLIRQIKPSKILRQDINTFIDIKVKYMDDIEAAHLEAMHECSFLYTYYTDIYNKIKKDDIDLQLLYKLLDALQRIEDGKVDQHECSFEVGTLLKQIYVDSALKKSQKLDSATGEIMPVVQPVNISWKCYKSAVL